MIGQRSGYDVFLGGTIGGRNWREEFLELVKEKKSKIRCFNPIVSEWTKECIELENFVKHHAIYHIYVLSPAMRGCYTIAEMVNSAHESDKKTYVYIMDEDNVDGEPITWDARMKNSVTAVRNMLIEHGAVIADSISDMVDKIITDYDSTPTCKNGIF